MTLDAILAQARRWHGHLLAGGTLSATDMEWLVKALEKMQAAEVAPPPKENPR